jgi:hypothetical protein
MKQKIQIVLILAMIVTGIRLAWIFYERHQAALQPAKKEAPPLNPDYVTPRKLYAYDLKSAKELTQQPVWVKVGYAYSYYPYQPGAHRADLLKEAGKLLPLEKLEIKDVVTQALPENLASSRCWRCFKMLANLMPHPLELSATAITSSIGTRTDYISTGPQTSGRRSINIRSSPA